VINFEILLTGDLLITNELLYQLSYAGVLKLLYSSQYEEARRIPDLSRHIVFSIYFQCLALPKAMP